MVGNLPESGDQRILQPAQPVRDSYSWLLSQTVCAPSRGRVKESPHGLYLHPKHSLRARERERGPADTVPLPKIKPSNLPLDTNRRRPVTTPKLEIIRTSSDCIHTSRTSSQQTMHTTGSSTLDCSVGDRLSLRVRLNPNPPTYLLLVCIVHTCIRLHGWYVVTVCSLRRRTALTLRHSRSPLFLSAERGRSWLTFSRRRQPFSRTVGNCRMASGWPTPKQAPNQAQQGTAGYSEGES